MHKSFSSNHKLLLVIERKGRKNKENPQLQKPCIKNRMKK